MYKIAIDSFLVKEMRKVKNRTIIALRKGLSIVLAAAMIATSTGSYLPPRITVNAQEEVFTKTKALHSLLDAFGVEVSEVTESDYETILTNLQTSKNGFFKYVSEYNDLVLKLEEAATTGEIVISSTIMYNALSNWVYSMSVTNGFNDVATEKVYTISADYSSVPKEDDKSFYGFVTPTNTYNESTKQIEGSFTINLNKPQVRKVNLSTGKTVDDYTVKIQSAIDLFKYNKYKAVCVDNSNYQDAEINGVYNTTTATKAEDSTWYLGTKHKHTGNAITGGGCYTDVLRHGSHVGCSTNTLYAAEDSENQNIKVFVDKKADDRYILKFYSLGSGINFWMTLDTKASTNAVSYYKYEPKNKYLDPDEVISADGTTLESFFGGGNALADWNAFIQECIDQVGEDNLTPGSTDKKNAVFKWVDFYDSMKDYMDILGYSRVLCPAEDYKDVPACGMSTSTPVGYKLACGQTEGLYYRGASKTPEEPQGAKVITSVEPVNPMQIVSKGNKIDTTLKFTYLDGHTTLVNYNGRNALKNVTIAKNYLDTYTTSKVGKVYPFTLDVTGLFGGSASEANNTQTTKTVTILAEVQGTYNASEDAELGAEENSGVNEVVLPAGHDSNNHLDSCYPGLKHEHVESCTSNPVMHSHSSSCGYKYEALEDDLRVYFKKTGSTIFITVYSESVILKDVMKIGGDTVSFGSDSNLADKTEVDFTSSHTANSQELGLTTMITGLDGIASGIDRSFNDACKLMEAMLQKSENISYLEGLDYTDFPIFYNSCINADKANTLGEFAKAPLCNLTTSDIDWSGTVADVCGKTEGHYYDEDTEVDPICDKVIKHAEAVYGFQKVYAGNDISTLVKLEYLNGKVEYVNVKGSASNPLVDMSCNFNKNDYTHVGEDFVYYVSLTNCKICTDSAHLDALHVSTSADIPVTIRMLAGDSYTVDDVKQTQVIMQGTDPEFGGTIYIGSSSVTTEQYSSMGASFSTDVENDWIGEHAVTLKATIGSSSVSAVPINVWIVPKPAKLTITKVKDVRKGEEPEFNLKLEYGVSSDPETYVVSNAGPYSLTELQSGVVVPNSVEYQGKTLNFSETVKYTGVVNTVAGETGTDHNTGGIYKYSFSSSGNGDLTATENVSVTDSCTAGKGHADFQADSCPVCDYSVDSTASFVALKDSANATLSGILAAHTLLETFKTNNGLDISNVTKRFKTDFTAEMEAYSSLAESIQNLYTSKTEVVAEIINNYDNAVTKDDVDTALNAMQDLDDELTEKYNILISSDGDQAKAQEHLNAMKEMVDKSAILVTTQPVVKSLTDSSLSPDDNFIEDPQQHYAKTYDGATFSLGASVQSGIAWDSIVSPDDYYVEKLVDVSTWEKVTDDDSFIDAGTYTFRYVLKDDDKEYDSIANPVIIVTVYPKEITCKVKSKEYDRNTRSTLDFDSMVGLLPQDLEGLSSDDSKVNFTDASVGTRKSVIVEEGALTGTRAHNYKLVGLDLVTADITLITLSCTVSAEKVYDKNKNIQVVYSDLTGVLDGDSVNLSETSVSGVLASEKAGDTTATIATDDLPKLTGANKGNYKIVLNSTVNATVKPYPIACDFVAQSKEYDGTGAATLSVSNVVGTPLEGDSVTLPQSVPGIFDTKDVGNNKPITVSEAEITLSGADADNYTLSANVNPVADITPKTVTYTLSSSKVYDACIDAIINVSSLQGVLTQDNVQLEDSTLLGRYDNANVGTDHVVTCLQNIVLLNNEAGNYVFTQPTTCLGTITQKSLTYNSAVVSKVYDNTDEATITLSNLEGVCAGDDVQFRNETIKGKFSKKTVGESISVVDVDPVVLVGDAVSNYSYSQIADSQLSGDIYKADVLLTVSANDREYDGTNSVPVSIVEVEGLPSNTNVVIPSVVSGNMADKCVGNDKLVNIESLGIEGDDLNNINVAVKNTLTINVTPKVLDYTVLGQRKTYNGKSDCVALITLDAGVDGDDVSLESTALDACVSDNCNVGFNKPIVLQTLPVIAGADASNYVLGEAKCSPTVDVMKKTIYVTTTSLEGIKSGSFSEQELKDKVDIRISGILVEESDDVLARIEKPRLKTMELNKVGTYPILFVEGTGNATTNYKFSYEYNAGTYEIVKGDGEKVIIHTGYPNSEIAVTVTGANGEGLDGTPVEVGGITYPYEIHGITDENGDLEIYLGANEVYIKVELVDEDPYGNDVFTRPVTIPTGKPNTTVLVTVNGETFEVVTDENGNLILDLPAEDVLVRIEFPDGSESSYWVNKDAEVSDVIDTTDNVIIKKNENGDFVWIDESGTEHPIYSGNVIILGDGKVPSSITVDDGFNGNITIKDVITSTDRPFIDVVNGSPTIDLVGDNQIEVPSGSAGIHVKPGNSVTIDGTGSIIISGNSPAAAIGGNEGEQGGNIIIDGGNVEGSQIGDAEGVTPPGSSVIISGGSNVEADVSAKDVIIEDSTIKGDVDAEHVKIDESNVDGDITAEDTQIDNSVVSGDVNSDNITNSNGDSIKQIIIDIDSLPGDGPFEIIIDGLPPITVTKPGNPSVWIPTNPVPDVIIKDTSSNDVYKVDVSGDSGTLTTPEYSHTEKEEEDLNSDFIFIDSSGKPCDVIPPLASGDVSVFTDGGIHYYSIGGKRYVLKNENLVINGGASKVESFIFKNYEGTVTITGVDKVCNKPYLDILEGKLILNVVGINKIHLTEDTPAIHVAEEAILVINGNNDSKLEISSDVEEAMAASIGGKVGKPSGIIIINGGLISSSFIGNAKGSTGGVNDNVIINGGMIDTDVNAEEVKDSDNNLLNNVIIDASEAADKENIYTTKVDNTESTYFKVLVKGDSFSQWVPQTTDKIWCYSDSKLYYADLNVEKPTMKLYTAKPDDKPEEKPGDKPGAGDEGDGGEGDTSSGGSGSGSGTEGDSSDNKTDDKPETPVVIRPEILNKQSSEIVSILLKIETSGNLKWSEDFFTLKGKEIVLGDDYMISMDGKNFSKTLGFSQDGYYLMDLFIYCNSTGNTILLRKALILVDTTAPELLYSSIVPGSVYFAEKVTSKKVYTNKSVSVKVIARDTFSKTTSVQYKIVPTGKKTSDYKWKKVSSKITLKKAGSYRIYLKAKDSAGNSVTESSQIIVIDHKKPTCSIKKIDSKSAKIQAKDNKKIATIKLDGKKVKNGKVVKTSGKHTIEVRDVAGNVVVKQFRLK